MKVGDKVVFVGKDYNISKIFNYEEMFKDKELVIEDIIKCPCDSFYLDKIKFKGIAGYFRASLFEKDK